MADKTLHLAVESTSAEQDVTVANADTPLIPYSPNRWALLISNPGAATIYLRYGGGTATANQGIALTAGSNLLLDVVKHGAMVYGPWRAIAPGGSQTISYVETINSCPCKE